MLEGILPKLAESIAGRRMLNGINNLLIIDDSLVAKRFFSSVFTNAKTLAEKEYRIGCFLYEKGISVPKMHGVINSKHLKPYQILEGIIAHPAEDAHEEFRTAWRDSYVVMERIRGETYPALENGDKDYACVKFRQELIKVLELGYCPIDCDNPDNILFNRSSGRLYLLDFEFWTRMDPHSEDSRYFKSLTEKEDPFCHEEMCEAAYQVSLKPNP